jgi:hypothetical protein
MPQDKPDKANSWETAKVLQTLKKMHLINDGKPVTDSKEEAYMGWDLAKMIKEEIKMRATKKDAKPPAKPKEPIRPSAEAYKEFGDKVGYLMTTNTYNGTIEINNFSEVHAKNVLTVVNTALDLAAKWSKQDGEIIHHRREQLLYALTLIVDYRREKNTQDITFRDAGHYFSGRLQQWQTMFGEGGREGVNADKEPSRTLSHLSGIADRTYDDLKKMDIGVNITKHPAAPPGNLYWPGLGEDHYRKYDDTGSKYSILEKPSEQEAVQAAKDGEKIHKIEEELDPREREIQLWRGPLDP